MKSNKLNEPKDFCTKHQLRHGQKYKSCTPSPPTNKAQPEELKDVLWRIGAFDTLNHDQHIELQRFIANQVAEKAQSGDLTPDTMLLAENKRLREAGDKLYEAASYTGRTFDGTHRLLSAAAHWLDTRGKSSGQYQATLKAGGKET